MSTDIDPATRTLYLLRHAKSSWADPALDDADRPLANRGRNAAGLMASHLASRRVVVDLVLCSSALRTRQTLDVVRPSLGPKTRTRIEEGLYGASAAAVAARLRQVDEATRAVLVIGHNPALEELAEALAGDGDYEARAAVRRKFPTGALATITLRAPWSKLDRGSGYLESFVVPKALKRA